MAATDRPYRNLTAINGGIDRRSHQANPRLEDVQRSGNVRKTMTAEHAARSEQLHELTAGAFEPGDPGESDHSLLLVVG